MTRTFKKATALGLCVAIGLGGIGYAVAKDDADKPTVPQTEEKTQFEQEAEQATAAKDETVYVLTATDGSVQKIIVSDWLKNALAEDELSDRSELSDIKNVKGEESYTVGSDNTKIWDAQGNDIYYQGNIDKELPVGLSVTYYLDGQSISPQELVGKSGKVTVRFDYENRQYETVELNGKTEKVYVPFAVLTGMILDNDHFRNIEVVNGKQINDGDRTIVVGVAFPGLQNNLGVSRDNLNVPDYVELTADVTDFSFGMTVTVATNEVFNELDTENFDFTDSMGGSLQELTDAMEQLLDGSSALYDGLCQLAEKSVQLTDGVAQLATGTETVQAGAVSVDSGVGQLQTGISELTTGLNALSANSDSLNSGAEQVFHMLLATGTQQLQGAGISVPTLTIENYAAVLDGVITQLSGLTAQAGMSEAIQTIATLKASLDSYSQFYQGILTYTNGVNSAALGVNTLSEGANTLKKGTEQLVVGTETLHNGALTLNNSMPALTSGVEQLRAGALELSEGLYEFNEQGVQKLVELIDGDLEGITERLKATVNVSQNYRNFAGMDDEMDGQVKFIYRTDEVK